MRYNLCTYHLALTDSESSAKEATATAVTRKARVIPVVQGEGVLVGFAQIGEVQIPHPDKAEKGGEDAYFISNDKSVLAVFDGKQR